MDYEQTSLIFRRLRSPGVAMSRGDAGGDPPSGRRNSSYLNRAKFSIAPGVSIDIQIAPLVCVEARLFTRCQLIVVISQ